ncbi:MAG: transketolase [Patescibacteria group bacterium]
MQTTKETLENLAQLVRYFILRATTAAGSGHPSSSLSATDLMTVLFFGGILRFDLDHPEYPLNDRVIFSKGHAAPLLYALYAAAGAVNEDELLSLRKFNSPLEGHPMPTFRYTEVATGSLGQGLSVGAGMALALKRFTHPVPQWRDTPPQEGTSGNSPLERGTERSEEGCVSRVYVLLGDSEMAEGSVWEAIMWAGHEKLDNLVGIIDVNRLGQSGETMAGHDVDAYARRVAAFGWETIIVDGHNTDEILSAYRKAKGTQDKPTMIIAKTLKGKGVSCMENKEGWHGKALSVEEYEKALGELREIDTRLRGTVAMPDVSYQVSGSRYQGASDQVHNTKYVIPNTEYKKGDLIATRKAYGEALEKLAREDPRVVAVDAEVKNSTFAELVKKGTPQQFVEMFIAEQNMVGVAVGLAKRGMIPFCSTFAAFFTRAFDQIRMASYSKANVKFVGSHAGVSIGEDGPSQMGLEDIAMFRAVQDAVVLYPSDAPATERLVHEAVRYNGIVYLRTTRGATPVIYGPEEQFPIGGSKTLRSSARDVCTIVAAGITLFEALAAADTLAQEGIELRIIDCYSLKPIDRAALVRAAQETGKIITVEDHVPEGGLGEAVAEAIAGTGAAFKSLAVRKTPKSGTPAELLGFEEIDRGAILQAVRSLGQ